MILYIIKPAKEDFCLESKYSKKYFHKNKQFYLLIWKNLSTAEIFFAAPCDFVSADFTLCIKNK